MLSLLLNVTSPGVKLVVIDKAFDYKALHLLCVAPPSHFAYEEGRRLSLAYYVYSFHFRVALIVGMTVSWKPPAFIAILCSTVSVWFEHPHRLFPRNPSIPFPRPLPNTTPFIATVDTNLTTPHPPASRAPTRAQARHPRHSLSAACPCRPLNA